MRDESGNTEYLIPAPIIFDAAGEYGSAEYSLTEQNGNGKYLLTVTADSEWVNAESRAFPVTLDPAICPPKSTITDTFVNSSSVETSYSSWTTFHVIETAITYIKTSSLSFIPINSYVSNAELTLYAYGTHNTSIGVNLVTSDWDSTLTYSQTQASSPKGAIGDLISYTKVESVAGEAFNFDLTPLNNP